MTKPKSSGKESGESLSSFKPEHKGIQRGNRPMAGRQGAEVNNTTGRDPANRQTGKPDATMQGSSENVILRTCASVLYETFDYCLGQGGEHVEKEHLKCLVDTADIVTLYANFVARDSEKASELRPIVADSVKCAQEKCEAFDDEGMTACADVCRECYEHLDAAGSGSEEE